MTNESRTNYDEFSAYTPSLIEKEIEKMYQDSIKSIDEVVRVNHHGDMKVCMYSSQLLSVLPDFKYKKVCITNDKYAHHDLEGIKNCDEKDRWEVKPLLQTVRESPTTSGLTGEHKDWFILNDENWQHDHTKSKLYYFENGWIDYLLLIREDGIWFYSYKELLSARQSDYYLLQDYSQVSKGLRGWYRKATFSLEGGHRIPITPPSELMDEIRQKKNRY